MQVLLRFRFSLTWFSREPTVVLLQLPLAVLTLESEIWGHQINVYYLHPDPENMRLGTSMAFHTWVTPCPRDFREIQKKKKSVGRLMLSLAEENSKKQPLLRDEHMHFKNNLCSRPAAWGIIQKYGLD